MPSPPTPLPILGEGRIKQWEFDKLYYVGFRASTQPTNTILGKMNQSPYSPFPIPYKKIKDQQTSILGQFFVF